MRRIAITFAATLGTELLADMLVVLPAVATSIALNPVAVLGLQKEDGHGQQGARW
jgi:hypothetical protein